MDEVSKEVGVTQEVMHVRIRQVRDGSNREAVQVIGGLPECWHGKAAPLNLEDNLISLTKASIVTYMSNAFGVM